MSQKLLRAIERYLSLYKVVYKQTIHKLYCKESRSRSERERERIFGMVRGDGSKSFSRY